MKKSVLFGALMALPMAAMAEGVSYNFVQLEYSDFEVDGEVSGFNVDGDGDGWTIGGVFSVSDLVFLGASYSDGDADVSAGGISGNVELETTTVGIGVHSAQFTGGVDLFGTINYVDVDDDDGFGVQIGARTMITPSFEGNIAYTYVDVGDGSDGFDIGGVYLFTPNWGVTFGYEYATSESGSDEIDVDGFNVGIRYDFQM